MKSKKTNEKVYFIYVHSYIVRIRRSRKIRKNENKMKRKTFENVIKKDFMRNIKVNFHFFYIIRNESGIISPTHIFMYLHIWLEKLRKFQSLLVRLLSLSTWLILFLSLVFFLSLPSFYYCRCKNLLTQLYRIKLICMI